MPPQEVSLFLFARQLLRPNILVLDTRQPEDFKSGIRIKAAIPYNEGILNGEIGQLHYERVIGFGPLAKDIVELFSADHHNVFAGDLDAVAKEFPELCWCSMNEFELAEALGQPGTLVVDTRREGFNAGLRLRNAVNFIPNVGFTGWCRRVVTDPWYHEVVCYGNEAFSAAASFPDCTVHVYTGSLASFAASFPEHCFDPRHCSTYCHKELANELVPICDNLYIGSLVALPTVPALLERQISHIIVFTRSSDTETDPLDSPKGCNGIDESDGPSAHACRLRPSSPPPSPSVAPQTPSLDSFPPHIRLLHLQDTGPSIRILFEKYHAREFAKILAPNRSRDAVDLFWIVDLLNALVQKGRRVAVLCELGISRAPAVAAAYLHVAKGFSPADALNMVNKASNFCNPSDILNTLPAFHSRNQYTSPYKDLVISHIIPGLMCGSLQSMTGSRRPDAPLDPAVLQQHGITHILSLGERPDLQQAPMVKALHIEVEDTERSSLAEYWPLCYAFIDDARQGGGTVMVHCLAGVSRTGAIIIGYLMHHFATQLKDAFLIAWRKRPILQPNDGFLEELVHYEQQLFQEPSLPIAAIKDFELSHRLCFKWGV